MIWDLEHPERFYLIFTRPQWRSWLVKGAFIIAGYSLVLALHFVASLARIEIVATLADDPGNSAGDPDCGLHSLLFAQAKARDMWQNPLLPPHLLVQAIAAGFGGAVAGGRDT